MRDRRWTPGDIERFFRDWDFDPGGRSYLKFQSERYAWLLNAADRMDKRLRAESDGPIKVLDIGPAFQTELIRQWPDTVVNTVGFHDPRFKPRPSEHHTQFDLNDAQYPNKWPPLPEHDLLIMAEVIEHLYTSPTLVLSCLATWTRPGGYIIVQTPNAVALRRRIKMLVGRHPYEMIRDSRTNAGHIREYTVEELRSSALDAGWSIAEVTVHNYFRHPGIVGRAYNAACRLLPNALKDGTTICLRKRGAVFEDGVPPASVSNSR